MPSTMRARGGLLAFLAIVYVAYLVWQAPHTVHHFFEHGAAEAQNECALNASAERVSGTTVDLVSIAPAGTVEPAPPLLVPAPPPPRPLAVLGPRAPPHPAA
jgi:hypothetical protein